MKKRNYFLVIWCILASFFVLVLGSLQVLAYWELGDRLPSDWRDLPSLTGLTNLNGYNTEFDLGHYTNVFMDLSGTVPMFVILLMSPFVSSYLLFSGFLSKEKQRKNVLYWASLLFALVIIVVWLQAPLGLDRFFPCLLCWTVR